MGLLTQFQRYLFSLQWLLLEQFPISGPFIQKLTSHTMRLQTLAQRSLGVRWLCWQIVPSEFLTNIQWFSCVPFRNKMSPQRENRHSSIYVMQRISLKIQITLRLTLIKSANWKTHILQEALIAKHMMWIALSTCQCFMVIF